MAIRASTSQTQADWTPDARGQAVLSAIIKEHLRTGEPVGSRIISERFASGAGWSSATIRNVMAELEEHELVEQPHTSELQSRSDLVCRLLLEKKKPLRSPTSSDRASPAKSTRQSTREPA